MVDSFIQPVLEDIYCVASGCLSARQKYLKVWTYLSIWQKALMDNLYTI